MWNATRRRFLETVGAAGLAGWIMPVPALGDDRVPGTLMPTRGKLRKGGVPRNAGTGRFRPPTRLGMGGIAIGNGFAPATDQQCGSTLQVAWALGVRYFDTSPWYGFGLSERRLAAFLADQPRDEFVLSTSVGRLLEVVPTAPKATWTIPPPRSSYRYDYTAAGVRRSLEASLRRLGSSHVDIVFVHDLSPDNDDFGPRWVEQFEIAKKGAFAELTRMRKEGLIRAWGLAVGSPEPALRTLDVADPDIFLLATQYSLMDHREAVEKTFPALKKRGVSVVVGSPLNAGYLAGRNRYNYKGTVPLGASKKRMQMDALANKYGIDLRTIALQFCAAPDVVAAVIPGARTPEQANANCLSLRVEVPPQLWDELKMAGLIHDAAAVPHA